jgi:hypothetical protein
MKLLNIFYAACAIRAAFKVARHIKGNHALLVKASHKAIHLTAHLLVYAEYEGYHILGHKDISITNYLTSQAQTLSKADIIKHTKEWLWQKIKLTRPYSCRYTPAVYIDGDSESFKCERRFYNAVRKQFPYQSAEAMIRHYPELKTEIDQIMFWFNRFNPVAKSLRMCDVDLLR